MLVETWNQVAGWGIKAIKDIQTQVGLSEEDSSNDELVPAPLPTVATGGIFSPSEAERKEAATASSQHVALKAEHDALSMTRKAFHAQVPQTIKRRSAGCQRCR
jgi:hypothetical protein